MLNGYPPIEGRDNIYANFADFADQNANASLSWELEGADVAASGDLGYTWGTYFYIGPDEVGEEDLIEGNYVNIWRKSAAGNWEVIVDIENRTLLTEDSFSDDENADALMFDEGLVDEIGAGAN
jgi:ketosteroid isomerase-like protein